MSATVIALVYYAVGICVAGATVVRYERSLRREYPAVSNDSADYAMLGFLLLGGAAVWPFIAFVVAIGALVDRLAGDPVPRLKSVERINRSVDVDDMP